jgi:hypothetical protein
MTSDFRPAHGQEAGRPPADLHSIAAPEGRQPAQLHREMPDQPDADQEGRQRHADQREGQDQTLAIQPSRRIAGIDAEARCRRPARTAPRARRARPLPAGAPRSGRRPAGPAGRKCRNSAAPHCRRSARTACGTGSVEAEVAASARSRSWSVASWPSMFDTGSPMKRNMEKATSATASNTGSAWRIRLMMKANIASLRCRRGG